MDAFNKINGSAPTVYAERSACFTIIDDILLNMAAEVARGEHKHGSCGMGIYEAKCRCEAGYGIQIGELQTLDLDSLVLRLKDIRKKYLPLRFKQLQLSADKLGDYGELLQSDEILYNFAIAIMDHFKYVHVVEEVKPFLEEYDGVIFENGQGLLLDSENIEYAPHVTASRTGIIGPHNYLKRFGFALDEVVYVTRSYVTRHGAGPLPLECAKEKIGIVSEDGTNVTNQWQGALRYAKHENLSRFVEPVNADCYEAIKEKEQMPLRSLMITHLNETGDCVVFDDTNCRISDLIKEAKWKETFGRFYMSKTRYSEEMESV